MAFRGRGRGRGFGGGFGYGRIAKQIPYDDFPEDVVLPGLPNIYPLKGDVTKLIGAKVRMESFWKLSCYNLQNTSDKSKFKDAEIMRYSDLSKPKSKDRREALASYLKLIPSNFPPELIHGSKNVQNYKKRLRWDKGAGDKTLDIFEKYEKNPEGQEEKEPKEKKDDSEDEEDVEEEVEEESSDDDYNQNIDFDDDEDDLNMEEEAHEDTYD